MPLDPALERIPGLAGYLAMDQYSRGQEAQGLDRIGLASKLQDHFRNIEIQKKAKEDLEALGPNPSEEALIGWASKYSPPKDVLHYKQQSLDRKSAENERKQKILQQIIDEKNQLGALQGQQVPVNRQFGSVAQGVPQSVTDDQALSQFNAMPAGPKSVTLSPQGVPDPQLAPTAMQGGAFAPLMESTNPAIAARAKFLQDQVNSGRIKYADAERQVAGLTAQESAHNQRNTSQAATFSNQKERDQFHVENRPTTELPPLTGEALVSAGSQVKAGARLMDVVPGYGRNVGDRRELVRQEAIAQIRAENPGMSAQDAGQALVNNGIAKVASQRSIGQLETMRGATIQAVKQLDFNVDRVTQAMDKLGGGGIKDLSPILTAMARGEQKWTGEPAYAELFYFMHAAAMESARILQGGQASIAQLHQGAADEAKKWADANWTTPKQWKEGVAPAMKDEAKARIQTYDEAIKAQRLGGKDTVPTGIAKPTATQVKAAGWDYEPDKYEYRMVDGKVQRMKK